MRATVTDIKIKQDQKAYERALIEDALTEFDFHKAHNAMVFLDWPVMAALSIKELKDFAAELCEAAIERETTLSSGGFEATFYPNRVGGRLILKFVITDTEVGEEED